MPLLAAAICCCSSSAACVRPLATSTFESSRPRAQLGQHAVADDVDRDAARDLARVVAAHAVGEHGDARVAVDEDRVLVVRAHHPRMGQAGATSSADVFGHRAGVGSGRAADARPIQAASVAARRLCCESAAAVARRVAQRAPRPSRPTARDASHMPTRDDDRDARDRREPVELRRSARRSTASPRCRRSRSRRRCSPAGRRRRSTSNGKRSISFMMSWLPTTTSGMLTTSPKTSSSEAALGRAGDADHVVEAHHEVGDDDGLHRREQPVAGRDCRARRRRPRRSA